MSNLPINAPSHIRDIPVQQAEILNFNNKTAALHGDLSVVTIENLMQLMSHAGLSGDLHLVAPDNAACFIIRDGELVFGYLQLKLARIGKRLLGAGHITNENLRECLHIYQEKKSEMRLGEILVDRKYVSRDILEEVIKEQVKDCFFEVLSWKKGTFSFCVNEFPPEEDILLSERIDHLVLKGIVALDRNS